MITIDKHGRAIVLEIADEPDLFGQFEVALAVDGKDRYKASYTDKTTPAPTWKCEHCGQFYSERTAMAHARCQQEQDRRDAESMRP